MVPYFNKMSNEENKQFHEMGLDDRLLEAIARLGWNEPTLIQEKAIPYFLRGKDVLARARTGSGKTGAFLVPLIQKLLEEKANDTSQVVKALILAPTKELCHQIIEHIAQLTTLCKREVRCIDVSPQISSEAQKPLLADNPDIVVGTPLKILNHIQNENINFSDLKYIIIDEADLMFSYNHKKEIDSVLKNVPSFCQSFITSATLGKDVKKLKSLMLTNPVILKLEESSLPATEQLTQYVIKVNDLDKAVLLYALFRLNIIRGKTIIFVNTVDKGYKVKLFLNQFSIKACILNSELPVSSRCHIVDQFNRGQYRILITSDETTCLSPSSSDQSGSHKRKTRKIDKESGVSRGIDFQFVANIINFDFPPNVETYIHRVGRTARGKSEGTALSLVSVNEQKIFSEVEKELKKLVPDNEAVFKDFKFNLESLDGFRYRTCDAWKQCTSVAVKDCRKREIKQEILNSGKLKSFFEEHPKDLEVLRHDVTGKALPSQPHLKNVPEYNIPKSLRNMAVTLKKKKFNKNAPKRNGTQSESRFMKMKKDPLRSMKFSGFKKKSKNK